MPHRVRADNFAALAREFAKQPNLAATLEAIVVHTAATIEGAEHAAITIRRPGGRYQTIAATGHLPVRVDEFQYQTREGPCLQALTDHHVLRSDDLATDPRWPVFGRLVSERTDVVSIMSHRLMLEEENTIGALNMYSRKPAAFAPLDLAVLDELATHAAIALTLAASRDQNQNLLRGLESNRTVGGSHRHSDDQQARHQATGIGPTQNHQPAQPHQAPRPRRIRHRHRRATRRIGSRSVMVNSLAAARTMTTGSRVGYVT